MAVNASGDTATINNETTAKSFSVEVAGPMGDVPQNRSLENNDELGATTLASLTSAFNGSCVISQNSSGIMTESMKLPDDLVGLIIGRGGENIMRMQRDTGCRIQITQSIPGTKERPCTLSGTPEQIDVCRNMLNEIISRSQAGTLGSNFNFGSSGLIGSGMGGMGDGSEKSVEISIPPDKCGLIIGKGGETIKSLQQSLGVKMLLIQDTTENVGQSKPLRVTGPQMQVDHAVSTIHQMMVQRDKQLAEQKMDPSMFGENMQIISVPKAAVGVVIGKGGDMINQIQNITATRIQFKPEDPSLPERLCTITGPKEGVDAAIRRVQEIIQNVQERDGMKESYLAGSRGGIAGPPSGGMGGFGQWEAPNMNRGRGMGVSTEEHHVPANKTGLVIGKGGETIKQINMQSGAHAEIQRNPPPGSDLEYKTFVIKGTPEQIKMARSLIQEKVESYVGGGMGGGPMGGPPNQPMGGPPGNFGPSPQQNSYGGLPPGASYAPPQNHMQAPPQAQPAQSFQQQPWGNQFQQWSQPAASQPQPNGALPAGAAKPVAEANAAAWQSYMQYAQQTQAGYQAPAVSAANATQAVPDYSKQWDEYLKQTGAVQAAAAGALPTQAAPAAAAAAAAQALQQQVAGTPNGAAAPAIGQPATTQADYSAAWAEYYRQYYQMQAAGQQYAAAAAAAGPAPAQN